VVMEKNKKGRYPQACWAGGNVYHYGHCRSVSKMNEKLSRVRQYWGDSHTQFSGYGWIDQHELRAFEGTHPAVMSDWIELEAEHAFKPNLDYRPTRRDYRNRLRFWLEDTLGWEVSKKHYRALD